MEWENDAKIFGNQLNVLVSFLRWSRKPILLKGMGGAQRSIDVYLSKLVELKFVEKELSFSLGKPKQKPHYHVSDEYLRFYFRYIYPNKELIYRGLKDETLERINNFFDQHLSFTFEKIARQYLIRKEGVEKSADGGTKIWKSTSYQSRTKL